MKVTFSATRLQPLHQTRNINNHQTNNIQTNYNNSERLGPVVRISFRGNPDKQAHQFASFSAEDKGLGLKIYTKGGEAVVVQEASNSFGTHLGADVRDFLPYHSPENPEGKIKIIKGLQVDANGTPIHPKNYTTDVNNIEAVDLTYKLKPGEAFIVQDLPNKGQAKYLPLEKTDISGSIKKINARKLELEEIPYHVFKVLNPNSKPGVTKYLIHTPEMAKTALAYATEENPNPHAYVQGSDNLYATISRIFAKILPKFNNEAHGNYNPANIMLHDRQAYPSLIEMAQRSADNDAYYRGIKSHAIFHNPGRAYQGIFEDALAFLRIVGTEELFNQIKKLPNYQELVNLDIKRDSDELTKAEQKRVNEILEPVLRRFKDDEGVYNMTKIAIEAVKLNPDNHSLGTVSNNYEKEMLSHETKEISKGLTKSLAELKKLHPNSVISITNGSTPANLQLGNADANFGVGGNGLSTKEIKKGFAVFNYTPDGKLDTKQVMDAKKANTKWLLDLLAESFKIKGNKNTPSGLQNLFFNEEQIKKGSVVIGELSKYEEGDKLIMGWGRPDAQKGMPATMEAFLKFLKDETIPAEVKKKTKLLAGAGVWDKNADGTEHRDWINIKRILGEIQQLDNGAYAKNVMYVNGFFPNRLASAATFSIFTSVFEPCGITPLESYATGTPVISIKTGGAPDFIEDGVSGFLTKNPYLVNPEVVGKKETDSFADIDDARRNAITDEVKDCIKRAIDLNDEEYSKMVGSALDQRVDWHENAKYNANKCANLRYAEDIYGLKTNDAGKIAGFERVRNLNPFKSFFSAVQESCQAVADKVTSTAKTTSWGKVALTLIGLGAVGYGTMAYIKKQKNKTIMQPAQSYTPTTPATSTFSANQSLDNLVSANPAFSTTNTLKTA